MCLDGRQGVTGYRRAAPSARGALRGGAAGDPERQRPVVNRLAIDWEGDALVAVLRSPLRLFLAITGYCQPNKDPQVLTRFTSASELDDPFSSRWSQQSPNRDYNKLAAVIVTQPRMSNDG